MNWVMKILIVALFLCKVACDVKVTSFDLMKCTYGERGSLTATCVNATPNYFKSTLYKFDHLDEMLRCVNCTLSSVESNTFDLSGNQIKTLDLTDSKIETLKPKAFMGLIFLKYLILSNNKIRSIYPGTFTGTKKINKLDLSNNEISILSDSGFAELIELKELILRKNDISVIDIRAFKGLEKLNHLDLSSNHISAINNSLENMTSLEVVNLNQNNIVQLAGHEFFPLIKLNEIDLSENKLDDKFKIFMTPENQLRKISLASNNISSLWFEISHLDDLEELDLRFNRISEIGDIPFESMYNLEKLELAYNKLLEIHTGKFSGLPQLRTLNCSHNFIKDVKITGVFSLQNLHTLDLSHNNITDLDFMALISRVPTLSYLRLEDNLLPCDLEAAMNEAFAEENFKFVLYRNEVGLKMCVDKPHAKTTPNRLHDAYVENSSESISAVDITIFILISLIFVALGISFYIQYLMYRGVQITRPFRVASTVQLISSDDEHKDDDINGVRI